MNRCRTLVLFIATTAVTAPVALHAQPVPLKTRNVVLIVSDGLRWQEMFHGIDTLLVNRRYGHVQDTTALRTDFVRATPESARAALFPFIWNTIARDGVIFGDRDARSDAVVTNGFKFSYPGYNEMITGAADARIHSNNAGPNPNVSVFEWLDRFPALHGRVAIFGTWDDFGDIFNRRRSGLPIVAGWDVPSAGDPGSARDSLLRALYATTTRVWDDLAYDAFMQAEVTDYVHRARPRVMFVGYGETDEWAHAGRYDLVIRSAHQFDAFVAQLWRTMQEIPQYRDSTTFIITTDHGRGSGLSAWTDHGAEIDGAEYIWIAVIGPDTPARGAIGRAATVTQGQIAATVARLMQHDFNAFAHHAAKPIDFPR